MITYLQKELKTDGASSVFLYTAIVMLLLITILLLCGCRRKYADSHASVNNPIAEIDYKRVPQSTRSKFLHIDSYTVKNKHDIYFDSLLNRYSYFKVGDTNFVNSYVGSHGIVSFKDPIVSINKPFTNKNVALSTSKRYSDYNRSTAPLVNYANEQTQAIVISRSSDGDSWDISC